MDEARPGARLPAARGMVDRAREIAAGAAQPAVPRDAATVILVRPAQRRTQRGPSDGH